MADTLTCRTCGQSWVQHGNASGHCAGRHRTFYGETAFDRHLLHGRPDGRPVHADPACVTPGKSGDQYWMDPEGQWHFGTPVSAHDFEERREAERERARTILTEARSK